MVVGRPTDTLEDETLARTQPRFSDAQRAVLEALGERTRWSLPALAADEMQAFCQQNSIPKARSFPRPLGLAACCTAASPFHTWMDRYVPCEYRHSDVKVVMAAFDAVQRLTVSVATMHVICAHRPP